MDIYIYMVRLHSDFLRKPAVFYSSPPQKKIGEQLPRWSEARLRPGFAQHVEGEASKNHTMWGPPVISWLDSPQ